MDHIQDDQTLVKHQNEGEYPQCPGQVPSSPFFQICAQHISWLQARELTSQILGTQTLTKRLLLVLWIRYSSKPSSCCLVIFLVMTTPPVYLLQSLNEREIQLGTTIDQKQTEALRTSEKERRKKLSAPKILIKLITFIISVSNHGLTAECLSDTYFINSALYIWYVSIIWNVRSLWNERAAFSVSGVACSRMARAAQSSASWFWG